MHSILPKSRALAVLALADGSIFHGYSIGVTGSTVGEVVFNTSMTGYQEILTDPSYSQQLVTLTYPHIGNTGANEEDCEAGKVYASGLIVRNLPRLYSNFRATMSLPDYLKAQGVVAIEGLDTRKLTRLLRTQGAQNGCILALPDGQCVTSEVIEQAVAAAKAAASMAGSDLAKTVTCNEPYEWDQTVWQPEGGYGRQTSPQFHVVAYDFGVKYSQRT